jgi:hypothetical protein
MERYLVEFVGLEMMVIRARVLGASSAAADKMRKSEALLRFFGPRGALGLAST